LKIIKYTFKQVVNRLRNVQQAKPFRVLTQKIAFFYENFAHTVAHLELKLSD